MSTIHPVSQINNNFAETLDPHLISTMSTLNVRPSKPARQEGSSASAAKVIQVRFIFRKISVSETPKLGPLVTYLCTCVLLSLR